MLATLPLQRVEVCFSWIMNSSKVSAVSPQSLPISRFIIDFILISVHHIPLYRNTFVNKAAALSTFLNVLLYVHVLIVTYTINFESGLSPCHTPLKSEADCSPGMHSHGHIKILEGRGESY